MGEDIEWGPWIYHDGGPVIRHARVGDFVHLCAEIDGVQIDRADWMTREAFDADASDLPHARLIRYRIRKPRALQLLRDIAEGAREPQEVDA